MEESEDMMKEPIDPAAIVALFDQAEAAILNLVPILASYFRKLQAEGFSRSEAFELVLDLQAVMIPSNRTER